MTLSAPDLAEATSADLPEVEAFLAAHAESSMFLRGNLASHGLGDRDAPRALALGLRRRDGRLTAVFGVSNAGFALFQAPDAGPEDWDAYARWMRGRRLAGLTGAAPQVEAALAALKVRPRDLSHGHSEPHYRLDLRALRLDGLAEGELRLPWEEDRALLTRWYADFEAGTLGTPPDRAAEMAAQRADLAITEDRVRIFEHAGVPVAMTAFNAELPEIVQVGGVYAPPEHRNHRFARTAVARHLAEARDEGVRIAVLAAASPAACRAYEALGFEVIGRYTLALLTEPRDV